MSLAILRAILCYVKNTLADVCISFALTFALFVMATAAPALAGTLSCSITTAAACTGGTNTIVLRMTGTSNAHSELPGQTTAAYANNVICCNGVTGLSNLCSGTFATVLKLAAVSNSHVQQSGSYANSACLSISSGSVSVGYGASCGAFDTTLGSMSATTNAHVGNAAAYPSNLICGTASGAASLSLTVSSNSFGTVSPGAAQFATSTIAVSTSNATGWSVNLTSDTRTTSLASMELNGTPTTGVTDQTDWIPGAATTTAGNAVRIASLENSNNVFAFRVMTASGTVPFFAPSWWGSTDSYADSATTLWSGIASSTAANPKIGNSSIQSSGTALNTVLYYLKVPVTQQTGNYTAPITVTATANP